MSTPKSLPPEPEVAEPADAAEERDETFDEQIDFLGPDEFPEGIDE